MGQSAAKCVGKEQDSLEVDRAGSRTRPSLLKSQPCHLLSGIKLLNVSASDASCVTWAP